MANEGNLSVTDIVSSATAIGSVDQVAANAAVNAVTRARDVDTGIPASQLEGGRIFCVQVLVDDSESMLGTEAVVRSCLKELGTQLADAMNDGGVEVLICVSLLNGGVIQPYVMVDQLIELDDSNHKNKGGTPLFTKTMELLGTLLKKVAELGEGGRSVQSYTVLISDGDPTDSHEVRAGEIKSLVEGMTKAKQHIVSAISIKGAASAAFLEIGISPKWILNPNDPMGFKEAMAKVSRASKAASRGAGAFRTTQEGGFQ